MWWDTEEKEEDRSHQDNKKQYCSNCGLSIEFIWDRCPICKSFQNRTNNFDIEFKKTLSLSAWNYLKLIFKTINFSI